MKDMDAARRVAEHLVGDCVHFIFDTEGQLLRAVAGRGRRARWLDADEWERLWLEGLIDQQHPLPPPIRTREEDACPCPGCGLCVCRYVEDGLKRCTLGRCICPRLREPVRIGLRFVSACRTELELRRGQRVLYCLGFWTPTRGWDFTAAGDAKRRSMPRAVALLLRGRSEEEAA
jgi:hypothetical protein